MATGVKEASLVLPAPTTETTPRWWALALRLKQMFGVDRAIAYTVLARVVQILGSTGTVLLIVHFLTYIEQGYYYTLLSLVSLQTVFELGFSFVILQMAAHECAHLTLHADGRIEGDAMAYARLASILQKTLRWYLVAAAILCVALMPLGVYFFSRQVHTPAAVAWHGPWVLAVLAIAIWFLVNPFVSFLEGCGQVWQVARMRLGQALCALAMSWGSLLVHHGLYAPAMVTSGCAAVVAAFLWSRRNTGLAKAVFIALQAGQHEVTFLTGTRRSQHFYRAQWIELREVVVGNVNAAIRALRQRLFNRLFNAFGTQGRRDHFPAVLLLQTERFFQRVGIRLVHLEADVRLIDPVPGDGQRRIFGRHLLDAHDDVHGLFLLAAGGRVHSPALVLGLSS